MVLASTEIFLTILVLVISFLAFIFSKRIARTLWTFYIWKDKKMINSGIWSKDAQKYRTDKKMIERETEGGFKITSNVIKIFAPIGILTALYILFLK